MEEVQTPLRENWKKSGNLSGQVKSGKGQGKIFFGEVRENENVPVIERLIELLPSLKKYVKSVDDRKLTNPGTKSFETLFSLILCVC